MKIPRKTNVSYRYIRVVLGDQLNAHHSWYQQSPDDVLYVMMEVTQETGYVRHHRQKILAFFASMRNFSTALTQKGFNIRYLTLDDKRNTGSLTKNLQAILAEFPNATLQVQLPDEYRIDHQLRSWAGAENISIDWADSEHFLTQRDSIKKVFADDQSLLMETFYRHIRRRFGILMDGDKPAGGRWNFDADNRKKIPKKETTPEPLLFANDVSALNDLLDRVGVDTLGTVDAKKFLWPTSRSQARELLLHFCQHLLPRFGTYQDAMSIPSAHAHSWTLYHSRLSFALNCKMLNPLEVVSAAVEQWQRQPDRISINQVEGFVRQIIGWREYIRGIYWHFMPTYKNLNNLNHDRPLPHYFWDADTKMHCLQQAVSQSLNYAYAHHIQRLMVTGNFALLAGISPDEIDDWYLGIYIDAIEWVELPNTRGMSQYADGGLLATKPYVSSANYIHKMSHYCGDCYYQHSKKTGEKACPFNSLYWHFIHRHEQQFSGNHRMSMMYAVWHKKTSEEQQQLLQQAQDYLDNIETL